MKSAMKMRSNMKIENVLKLDKHLLIKKNIDGSKIIYRKSPFSINKRFIILDIENQFIGSSRWLRDRLIKMDTQRQNIIARVRNNNLSIRHRKSDNRMHREVADLITTGGDTFIN